MSGIGRFLPIALQHACTVQRTAGPDPIPTFSDERRTAALLVLQCGTMRPKVHPQLGKLMTYLQPPADSGRLRSVHLTVVRVPTPESIRLKESGPPPRRAVMIARAARSRLRSSMSVHFTAGPLPSEESWMDCPTALAEVQQRAGQRQVQQGAL
jgi:hypothetical protein